MNRLNELADKALAARERLCVEHPSSNVGDPWVPDALLALKQCEDLLRSASKADAGMTEWGRYDDPNRTAHNADLSAARVRIAAVEAERDAARADAARAVLSLQNAGWTLTEGATAWKPPIGKRPDFEKIDALQEALAEKQRAIDEAYAAVAFLSDGTALTVTKILRPHATPASPVAGPATVRPQCPPNVTITQGVVPSRDEVFGKPPRQWTSTPPADRSGKWWNAWSHSENNNGCVMVEERCSWDTYTKPELRGTVYDLWLPYVEGDTRDDLPPLPNPAGNAATPAASPCGTIPADDTRELIAKLAECITGLIEETDKDGYPVNDWTVLLREIITAARKEPADGR